LAARRSDLVHLTFPLSRKLWLLAHSLGAFHPSFQASSVLREMAGAGEYPQLKKKKQKVFLRHRSGKYPSGDSGVWCLRCVSAAVMSCMYVSMGSDPIFYL
jgi:hypothetical protein